MEDTWTQLGATNDGVTLGMLRGLLEEAKIPYHVEEATIQYPRCGINERYTLYVDASRLEEARDLYQYCVEEGYHPNLYHTGEEPLDDPEGLEGEPGLQADQTIARWMRRLAQVMKTVSILILLGILLYTTYQHLFLSR